MWQVFLGFARRFLRCCSTPIILAGATGMKGDIKDEPELKVQVGGACYKGSIAQLEELFTIFQGMRRDDDGAFVLLCRAKHLLCVFSSGFYSSKSDSLGVLL
jgi:hypothetical protein